MRLFNPLSSCSDKATANHTRTDAIADISFHVYQNLPLLKVHFWYQMYTQTPLLPSCTIVINSKWIKSSQITWMQHFINEVNSYGFRLQPGSTACDWYAEKYCFQRRSCMSHWTKSDERKRLLKLFFKGGKNLYYDYFTITTHKS